MGATTANTEQIFTGKVYNTSVVLNNASGTSELELVPAADTGDGLRIDSIIADYDDAADIELRFWLKRPDRVLIRQGVVKVDGSAGSTAAKLPVELLARWRGNRRAIQAGWGLWVQMLTAIPATKSLHITLDGGVF